MRHAAVSSDFTIVVLFELAQWKKGIELNFIIKFQKNSKKVLKRIDFFLRFSKNEVLKKIGFYFGLSRILFRYRGLCVWS